MDGRIKIPPTEKVKLLDTILSNRVPDADVDESTNRLILRQVPLDSLRFILHATTLVTVAIMIRDLQINPALLVTAIISLGTGVLAEIANYKVVKVETRRAMEQNTARVTAEILAQLSTEGDSDEETDRLD